MQTYGGVEVYHHNPGTYWAGGWVGPRADLDAAARRKKKSQPLSGIESR